ncbi:MAG TPA: endonuclease/exonuclease/phosphatase family protein [Candidatus Saccharimonadales bacterium]
MLSGLTYNVFLGMNLKSLLAWLYNENDQQDFYCFQEFPEQKIPDLKAYLDKLGYDFQFTPGFVRYGVTYGELTAFKKSKLKLLSVETVSLGGKGERNIVFTHNGFKLFRIDETEIDKSALLTKFQYHGHDFTLVNAHLSTDLHNSRKLKQLGVIIETLSAAGPTVILGDFNYAVGRRKLTKIMNGHGFKSGLPKQKTFRFARGISWQNDYVFHRGCEIKSVSVKRVSYSDHYPVFFRVNLFD